jgi:Xaa-Pro aminopeptidase
MTARRLPIAILPITILPIAMLLAGLLLVASQPAGAQPLFTSSLPREQFAARRAKVLDAIGDAVAVLQGATEYPAYVKFRQANQFYYLTGVEVPRALLLVDGRRRQVQLFLEPRNERRERSEGPVLVSGEAAANLTGIDIVRPRTEFGEALARAADGVKVLYVPHRPETLQGGAPDQVLPHAARSAEDPWDGRPSRESVLRSRLAAALPGAEIRDLDPIVDRLRLIKSPAEIALIREATRISGLAIMEAMRAAEVGMHEYELEAIGDYVFKRHNAQGPAYYALVASGANAYYPHYHAAQSVLDAGDLVLYDYAPDYEYYTSDVTRQFPASGTFTPAQRELYTVYLRLYQALMSSIRPRATPKTILADAVAKMDKVVDEFPFTADKHRDAARRMVDGHRNSQRHSVGHMVGMEVHDVTVPFDTLEPGMVFTIEPALTIPEDRLYIRLEDVILVTDDGYENLSAFVPVEPDDLERLMAEPSVFAPSARPGPR